LGAEVTPRRKAYFIDPKIEEPLAEPLLANTALYPKAHHRIVTRPAQPKHWATTERIFLRRTRPP